MYKKIQFILGNNIKMKRLLFFVITSFFVLSLSSQDKYITRSGHVSFVSETPLENITGINDHVSSILDVDNGAIVLQMKIISFEFEKALMQEHFNEKYMESEKYPKSTFSGTIDDWQNINLTEGKMVDVAVEGVIEIHDVKKVITANGTLQLNNGSINLRSNFSLKVADFNIKVLSVVRDKVAKRVDVSVDLSLKQRK
tara:strand:- start:772 stop:1365 length:594 start_codon:yes stop_codon:yes gene_type:complete